MTEPEPAPPPVPNTSGRLRLEFPPQLPISARAADIAAAMREHAVIIVAGATGSGKTTQLPKVALSLGRGQGALIGVTQPRRIAATSVASRVASELECPLGAEVGYQIRFDDRTSKDTRLKFMTDGILLAEIQADRLLRRYDTLIIDEAHERSLTIDFLLGWLARILPERPDLKVVISSATIETERFSTFFGRAPVLQVEGRTFPVDVLYEPFDPELDLHDAVADAVENISSLDPRGDILVFLPGEREIREAELELARRAPRATTIQPLYSRLSAADQSKVFAPVSGRRIILATNVAETSLTLPGIVYVVDTGTARLSRYDARTGTTRLLVEPISQASADQRKGRCGRVREGICVRLYDEASFQARPEFTDPEIKRTGLAGVILRMKSLGLGDVEDFPFIDAPSARSISEGYRVLEELGALDEDKNLTPLGRRLARLPVDPRIGRMILAGAELGCLPEVLVVAAALELQDPRERPRGLEQKADGLHRRFRDERSDFVSLLRLWAFVREAQRKSTGHLKRVCKDNYLSFVRVREWTEVHRQLGEVARELGMNPRGEDSRRGDGARDARPRRDAGAARGAPSGVTPPGAPSAPASAGAPGAPSASTENTPNGDGRRSRRRRRPRRDAAGAPGEARAEGPGDSPGASAAAEASSPAGSAREAPRAGRDERSRALRRDEQHAAGSRGGAGRGGSRGGAGSPRAPGRGGADRPRGGTQSTPQPPVPPGQPPADGPDADVRPENEDALHQALLSGLLSRIGMYNPEHRVYVGARQTRFVIHPSSGLSKKPPAWVMAHELVQTTQLFARNVARFDPNWLDRVGAHLLKRSYAQPHWSEKAGRAKIREHATLYGLPVLKDRSVDYATVAPVRARLMFIEHALVRGEYETKGAFQKKNRELLAEVSRLRDKARKSDMLTDEEARIAFFDQRLPASVTSGQAFEAWREQAEQKDPTLLHLRLSDVLGEGDPLVPEHYPDSLTLHGVELPLEYKFDPSVEDDGVTVVVPLALLLQLEPGELDWTIMGWHREQLHNLLDTVPRALRRELGPLPALAERLAGELRPFSGPLLPQLARAVSAATGVRVEEEAFRLDAIPHYLRLSCRVVGERGKVIAQSRDVSALIREHAPEARQAFARESTPPSWERAGLTRWDFGAMPEFVTRPVLGAKVRAYPAIVDRQRAVDLTLLESREAAESATRAGVRRLLMLGSQRALAAFAKRVPAAFPRSDRMPPSRAESDAFRDRVLLRVIEEAFGLRTAALPRSAPDFEALLHAGQRSIDAVFERVSRALVAIAAELDKTQRALSAAARQPSGTNAARDISAQLELLMRPELIDQIELERLEHYPRYLRAAQTRLSRAITDPRKDADKLAPLLPLYSTYLDKQKRAKDTAAARAIYFDFEELRVAIFAPELKPAYPVSVASIARSIDTLR